MKVVLFVEVTCMVDTGLTCFIGVSQGLIQGRGEGGG